MVGFPKNIRALYVDQLDASSDVGNVLEAVLAADRDVLRWRQQAAALQVGLLRGFCQHSGLFSAQTQRGQSPQACCMLFDQPWCINGGHYTAVHSSVLSCPVLSCPVLSCPTYSYAPDSSADTQEALQAGAPDEAVRAVKALRTANLRAEVAEAELTNELRSGTRGDQARHHLLDLEARYMRSGLNSNNFFAPKETMAV